MLMLLGCTALWAEVPELTSLVPEAQGYELIAKLNPLEWSKAGYAIDRTKEISGDLKRIGYLLKLYDKHGKVNWIFTSMNAFTPELSKVGLPMHSSEVYQTYVDMLEVFSNVAGIKVGKFDKGNIEIWNNSYEGSNSKGIPGATDKFDFGDTPSDAGQYGSFQVHNYLEKQTGFAFNNFYAGRSCDLGIGNRPGENTDRSHSRSGINYELAELLLLENSIT